MPTPVNLPPLKGVEQNTSLSAWARLVPQMVNRLGEARAYEILTPLNGFAHTIPNATGVCLMTPAGFIAAGTLTLPAQASDGFQQEIVCTQSVGALTVAPSTGQTIIGATFFAVNPGQRVVYFFVASASTWYKIQ